MIDERTRKFRVHMKDRRSAVQNQQNFKAETIRYLDALPRKNLQLTMNNHKMFTEIVTGIRDYSWSDPDVVAQCDKLLKEELTDYVREIRESRQSLGIKTAGDKATVNDIHWLG